MMKLAFCLFKYFPFGGLQRDFLRIVMEAIDRGHEVHVFAMHWQGDVLPGITLHLLPVKGWQNHTRCQAFANALSKKLAEYHFDLVIGFNKLPNLDVYYAADVCFAARYMRKNFLSRLQPRYKCYKQLEKAVFAKEAKTKILMISAKQQKEFTDHYQTEMTRFHLLPPGIARDRLAPENAQEIRLNMRKSLGLKDHEKLLLMVGSGFKTKGVDRSIRALSGLPKDLLANCHLFVIGQDDAKPFMQLAKRLQVDTQIHFLGGRNDVPAFLLAADLLLHPSYHENTGTALLEALAAELPVLTIDVCGYAHYITDANAGVVLSSPFDQVAMQKALAYMLTTNEYVNWRKAARDFAKTADIYSMPLRAIEFIESCR